MKKKALMVLALCLLLTLLAGSAMPGFAAKKPALITGNGILWLTAGKCPVVAINLPSDATSFKVKTSDKSILKVGQQEGFGPYGWWMEPVKAGKATITLKYKTGGKNKSVKGTFQVKEYPKPFEYIKINDKKINLKKDQSFHMIQNYSKNKITVDFKVKSGWKVTECGGDRIKGDDWMAFTWKKGKSISLKGYDAADILIKLKNKKTGETCDYEIAVSR